MIEKIPFLWFFAFAVNITLGTISFYIVASKKIKTQYQALGWWCGWWAYLGAFSLALNASMGTDYFWSYHQTGIITDTAINLALIVYILKITQQNWALNDEDWQKIEEIRKQAKIREISK